MNTTISSSIYTEYFTPIPTLIATTTVLTASQSLIFPNSTFTKESGHIAPSGVALSLSSSLPNETTFAFHNVNSSSNSEDGSSQEVYLVFFTVFYAFIVLCGAVGNSLVLSMLIYCRNMRSPCNLLIANISAADLVVTVFVTPIRILELYWGWPLGRWGCYVLFPIQDILVAGSVFTHTALALERRHAVVSPFKRNLSLKKVKFLIVGMWFGCFVLLGVPEMVPLKYAERRESFYCWPDWPSARYRRLFETYIVMVFIVVPLMVQCTAYGQVVCVQRRTRNIEFLIGESSRTRAFAQLRIKQKRKIIKMMILMMTTFQVCYIPRGMIMMIGEFAPWLSDTVPFSFANSAILVLFYLKHVINPVLLWFMSQEFHNGLIAIFTCNKIIRPKLKKKAASTNLTSARLSDLTSKSTHSVSLRKKPVKRPRY